MTDYTPDSLRALAHSISELAPNVDLFDLAADAWDADYGMWKDAKRHVDRLEDDNAALRYRLEAAERAIDDALDFIAVNNWAGAHDVLYETRYPRPDTKASTTAGQREEG